MGWSSSIREALAGGSGPTPPVKDLPASLTIPTETAPAKAADGSMPKFQAFDPTALERGVKAIRELNESPFADKALDLIREQEVTKQLETKAAIEDRRAHNNEYAKTAQMEMEEQKKRNEMARLEEERQTALYKAKVQTKLEQQHLQDKRQYDDEQMRKQHEAFLQQERIRKENDAAIEAARLKSYAMQAKLDQETAKVRETAKSDGRIKQERDNEDVQLRRLEVEQAAALTSRMTSIKSHYENIMSIGSAVKEAASDPEQCVKAVALVTALSLGFFGARNGTHVIGKFISARLGRPQLVRETSRRNWLSPRALASSLIPAGKAVKASTALGDVVLAPALRSRLTWIADTALATAKHKSPYRHLLLHGPPGTGKTLFARALALDSHMDYAIISGGDLSQLGNAAVTELHALFDWAEKSPRGAVLFFDEADSFLRKGRDDSAVMSEQGRHVLSAFLQRTGSDSKKFMIVLASNMELNAFDDAVRDRMDEFVEFSMPTDAERTQMLSLFFDKYLKAPPQSWLNAYVYGKKSVELHEFNEADVKTLSGLLDGFSGRQIAKFVISMRAAVYGSLAPKANLEIAEQLLRWREWDRKLPTVEQMMHKAPVQKHGHTAPLTL